jgi:hypothetical protein
MPPRVVNFLVAPKKCRGKNKRAGKNTALL